MWKLCGAAAGLAILLVSDRLLSFERFLLRSVLNEPISLERARISPERRIFAQVGQRLAEGQTWKGLLYLLLRFGMGTVSLVLVLSLIPLSLLLVSLPLTYQFVSGQMFISSLAANVRVTSFDQALVGCTLGATLTLLSAHILNAWTGLWKRIAGALLS